MSLKATKRQVGKMPKESAALAWRHSLSPRRHSRVLLAGINANVDYGFRLIACRNNALRNLAKCVALVICLVLCRERKCCIHIWTGILACNLLNINYCLSRYFRVGHRQIDAVTSAG